MVRIKIVGAILSIVLLAGCNNYYSGNKNIQKDKASAPCNQPAWDFNLHRYAYIGDLKKVKHALKHAAINSKDQKRMSALMLAAFKDREDVVEYLINQGADCHFLSPGGRNILSYAVQNKNPGLVKKFLALNVLPGRYKDGKDTLWQAVYSENLPVLNLLLAHFPGVDTAYVIKPENDTYRTQTTLLLQSIEYSPFEVTQLLVEKGADIQKANSRGETPLLSAMRNGKYETAKYLISKGAMLDAKDRAGNTLLSYAMKAKKEDLALQAITSGIPLDTQVTYKIFKGKPVVYEYDIKRARPGQRHYNYLHMAAAHGLTRVAKALLDKGADISSPNGDVFDLDAAGFAAFYGHADTLKLLLDSGATPYKRYTNSNPAGDYGLAYFAGASGSYTLLSLAVISQNRSEKMIAYLLDLPESRQYAKIEKDPFYINLMMMTEVGPPTIFNKTLVKMREWGFKNSEALDRKYKNEIQSPKDETPVEKKTTKDLILEALKQGDLEKLKEIKNRGVNIPENCPNAAFYAVSFDQENLILPLIDDFEIDINRTDKNSRNQTIVNRLAKFYQPRPFITNKELFMGLVDRGMDINIAPEGITPLTDIIDDFDRDPDLAFIKAMIDRGADFGDPAFALKRIYTLYDHGTYTLVVNDPLFQPVMEKLYRNSDLADVAIDLLKKRDPITYEPKYPERVEKLMEIAYWNSYAFDHSKLADYAKQKGYEYFHRVVIFYKGSGNQDAY